MKDILAVVNCKSLKCSNDCEAAVMYSKSKIFRAQISLINQYADYVILSAQLGVVFPDQIISPYNLAMKSGSRLKNANIIDDKSTWIDKVVDHDVWGRYDEIHFHLSNSYYDPIAAPFAEKHPTKIIKKIRQQVNPGLSILRYQEASEYYQKHQILNYEILEEARVSTDPEIARWFYHPIHPPFFGFARNLVKQYPEVDEGNLCRVSRGLAKQTRGWVRDELLIPRIIYNEKNNQWRMK